MEKNEPAVNFLWIWDCMPIRISCYLVRSFIFFSDFLCSCFCSAACCQVRAGPSRSARVLGIMRRGSIIRCHAAGVDSPEGQWVRLYQVREGKKKPKNKKKNKKKTRKLVNNKIEAQRNED
jgi:hypothetical protein